MKRDDVISLLYNAAGRISGQEIADKLGVSRMTVSNEIKAMRKAGYQIDAKTGEGYLLVDRKNVVCRDKIESLLIRPHTVEYMEETDSTNSYLKKSDISSDHIVIASSQREGRGRRGKNFYSPGRKGIYFSFLVHKEIPVEDMWAVTFIAAIAVARAIRRCKADAKIKWVNDIYVGDKKICGILTEAELDPDNRHSSRMIVGIGINLKKCRYPAEIKKIATNLEECGAKADVNILIGDIVNDFDEYLEKLDIEKILSDYEEMSMMTNRQISFIIDGEEKEGVAVGLTGNGNLIVRGDREYILSSGEVSVRFENNGKND